MVSKKFILSYLQEMFSNTEYNGAKCKIIPIKILVGKIIKIIINDLNESFDVVFRWSCHF